MNPISRYLLVKAPYIWRTRVFPVLPLLIGLDAVFFFLGGLGEPDFRTVGSIYESASGYAVFQSDFTIILVMLSGFWLYSLFSFPLKNERIANIALFGFIAFLINAALLAGPVLYLHADIVGLGRLAQTGGDIHEEYANASLACRGNLSPQETAKLAATYKRWSGNQAAEVVRWEVKDSYGDLRITKLETGRVDTIDRSQGKYDWDPGKYDLDWQSANRYRGQARTVPTLYFLLCVPEQEKSIWRDEVDSKVFDLWNFEFQGGYEEADSLLRLVSKLQTLKAAYRYTNAPGPETFRVLVPAAGVYILWLVVLTLVAIMVSTRAFGRAGRIRDTLLGTYHSLKEKLITDSREMRMSQHRPLSWALGLHKLASDTIIFTSMGIIISMILLALLGGQDMDLVSAIVFGTFSLILIINSFEKWGRQLHFHLVLNSVHGNIWKLLLSAVGQLPFALLAILFLLGVLFYYGHLIVDDRELDLLVFIILIIGLVGIPLIWSATVTLVVASTSRRTCLVAAACSIAVYFAFIPIARELIGGVSVEDIVWLNLIPLVWAGILAFRGIRGRVAFVILSALIPLITINIIVVFALVTEETGFKDLFAIYYYSVPVLFRQADFVVHLLVGFLATVLITLPFVGYTLKKLSLSDSRPRPN